MMPGLSVDLTINLTSIISLAVALITFVTAFNRLTGRIDLHTATMNGKFTVIENRLGSVEETLRDSKATNERLAVIEVRQNTQAQMIASIGVDIHDLRVGKGLIERDRK
jgi:hypothetical protein